MGTVLKDDAIPTLFDAQPENQTLKRSKDTVGKKNILAGVKINILFDFSSFTFLIFPFL